MFLNTAVIVTLALAVDTYSSHVELTVPLLINRIVGGQNAIPGQFPYQVSLQWGLPPILPLHHFCGGSIINDTWVLTAGHCVKAVPDIRYVVVKAGKLNITAIESFEQQMKVKKAFVHSNYTGGVAPYDIALLLLENPLVFNKNVSTIKLPKFESVPYGNSLLSGWGSVSKTPKPLLPQLLQYVQLPIIDVNNCKSALEDIAGPSPLHETNVCTGPLSGGFGACSGDSGGPLVLNNFPEAELIGIVSWGIIPCGTRGAPSVYTRTSAFIDWIQTIINDN